MRYMAVMYCCLIWFESVSIIQFIFVDLLDTPPSFDSAIKFDVAEKSGIYSPYLCYILGFAFYLVCPKET